VAVFNKIPAGFGRTPAKTEGVTTWRLLFGGFDILPLSTSLSMYSFMRAGWR